MSAAALARTPARRMWRRFLRHRLAVASLLTLAALALASLSAPLVERALGIDANAADLFLRMQPPSAAHPLGTDELGRDVLCRLLYGGRVSLGVGLAAAVLSAIIGTAIGLLAGYSGGLVDRILMRFNDAVIALPLLPLLIVLAAVDLGKLGLPAAIVQSENVSLYRIVAIVTLFGWNTVARLVRAETLALRQREFVRAAVALGTPPRSIMLRHILPNAVSPIIVATTLSIGHIILFESTLSFLGLGIQPPLTSLGQMLGAGRNHLILAWWIAVIPGVTIFLTTLSISIVGDWLRDRLDPTLRGR